VPEGWIRLRVDLGAEQVLGWYRGEHREVVALAVDGRLVQFPMRILQPWFTMEGVHGEFWIRHDAQMRFTEIRPLDPTSGRLA
jgi:Protein of unknown function (DUF2835)